jgi:hypothetical protein
VTTATSATGRALVLSTIALVDPALDAANEDLLSHPERDGRIASPRWSAKGYLSGE